MMKLKQLLNEGKMDGKLAKMLNFIAKKGVDASDISEVWDILEKTFVINDRDFLIKGVLIYRKYKDLLDDENPNFNTIEDVDLEYDPDDIDDEVLVLAQFLEIHPLLVEDSGYGYYEIPTEGEEYRVLTESDADEEFRERADESIDDHLSMGELGWLEDYLELNEYSVEQLASEDADNRVDDMSAEEIIEEMENEDELAERMSKAEKSRERWFEVDNLIVEVQGKIEDIRNDIEDLRVEANDLRGEAAQTDSREEVADLENEYVGVMESIKEQQELLEYYEEELEELEYEFEELDKDWDSIIDDIEEDLAEELKDELREELAKRMYDEIMSEGVEYFYTMWGYKASDVIDNGWADIDREGAIDALEHDRGGIMSSYDGIENEEYFNGETYYIYRHN